MFRFANPEFLYLLLALPVLMSRIGAATDAGSLAEASAAEILVVVNRHDGGYFRHCRPSVWLQIGDRQAAGRGNHGLPGCVQLHDGRRHQAEPSGESQANAGTHDG